MGSRGKRKLDENVLKDVVSRKKPRCLKVLADGIQKLSQKGSQAAPSPGNIRNMGKSKDVGYVCSAVPGKEKTHTIDVKRTHKGLRKQHSRCLSKVKTQNTSQRSQQSNMCVKEKMVPADCGKDYSQIKSNSKKQAIVNSVQEMQKSVEKKHSEVKSVDNSTETGVLSIEKNSGPSLKAENFSSNWKSLQQILQKQTKKVKPTFHHKKQSKGFKKKSDVKETEKNTESESKIWFDDVDDILIESLKKQEEHKNNNLEKSATDGKSDDRLVKSGSFKGLTKTLAVDCEMVGVGEGGKDSILARVSIVNHFGQCVYDKFVKPREPVTDYRTHVSGVRPENLKNGEEFSVVQEDVSQRFKDRVLVGHAIENDLKVLFLSHPRKMIRDTSTYKPFRKLFNGRKPALRKLAEKLLMVKVQDGEHNSVQDAQAAMRLYTMYRRDWEKEIKMRRKTKPASLKKAIVGKPVADTSV